MALVGAAGQVSSSSTEKLFDDMPRRHLSITDVTHVEDSVYMARVLWNILSRV
jgi:hypothetical protein